MSQRVSGGNKSTEPAMELLKIINYLLLFKIYIFKAMNIPVTPESIYFKSLKNSGFFFPSNVW